MRKEIEQWVEQARFDFSAAQENYKTRHYFVCAFISLLAVIPMRQEIYLLMFMTK
ncbi:MAG: hypothetical protein HYW50_01465 [Candidatus Diapherotrites archaeon]|nr:hypothetical protein [Candidatus Diapherotrites archaeon]